MANQPPEPPPCEVIVLTALPVEFEAVVRYLNDAKEIIHPSGTIYQRGTFAGTHCIWRVAVAEIGMGGPTAATETERAINYFQPRITLFVGVSGGLKDVKCGDVVAATKVYAYESGKVGPQFQPRPEVWRTSHALEQRARTEARSDEWLTRLDGSSLDAVPQVYIGALAAGEKVLASTQSDLFRLLKAVYGDALAIEMEGHGFLAAVHANHHVHALVIRGISDLIENKSASDAAGSQRLAARHAAAFAFQVLANYKIPGQKSILSSALAHAPVFHVPFPRNPFFTGREELLERLHARLQDSQTAVLGQPQALSGLGGVGKTQLAVEYAYRCRQAYPQAVLWAAAETTETLDSSYVEIARLLQLPEKDEPTQELIVQAVKNWLSTQSGWLLILDNADDLSIIPAFLPKNFIGHLLLTTREQALGTLAQSLEVDTLAEEQGALLLLRRAKVIASNESLEHASEQDRTTASAIARELGGLPLALDQAAAYIEETRCSLTRYQLQYQASQPQFLARRGGKGVQLHPQSVTTTLLSFAKIENMPVAADLLRFCAFLAPDAIPERLLVQAMFVLRRDALPAGLLSRLLPFQKNKAARPLTVTIEELWGEVQEALSLWRSYSLVQRVEAKELLYVHRLVQAVIRDSLIEQEQLVWMERVIRAMAACFPSGDELEVCALYFPHVLKCEEWVIERKLASLKGASLFSRVGYYLIMRVQYDDAERFFQLALTIRKKQRGESHIEVADSLNDLGVLAEHRGQFAEAECLYEQALAIAQRDQKDWKGLNEQLLYNLANIYRRLGKDELAEQFFQHLREQQKKLRRNETTKTLTRKANLYLNQDAYEQAEQLYLCVYELHERYEGIDSPGTAGVMTNLADLYKAQGKFAQAEPLYQATLSIYIRHRGDDHPSVADCLSKLGDMYEKQGKHEQAELFYQRALAIREQRLGDAHPDTASSLIDLAYLYKFQGRYAESEPLYQHALAIREQCLGAEHPDTVWTLSSLGNLYEKQGKNEQAEKLYLRALSIREQHLGASHHDTASSLNSLAEFYYAQGKYVEAEPLYVRALAIYEQQVGAEHPTFQAVQANYTSVLKALKEDKDAPP